MCEQSTMVEAQMMKFILGKWISKPIHVAATLAIPDILAQGARNINVISEITGTHNATLYRLMRALSSVGIFAETQSKVFVNTPLSACLLSDRLRSASLLFHSEWHDRIWDNLLYSVQTGEPAFERIFGESAFDWIEKHPDEAAVFHAANNFKAAHSHRVIVEQCDFEGVLTITDVGGGLGGLVIEILKANPSMKGVVAERPGIVAHLSEIIEEHGLEIRMSAAECDFFDAIPRGSDMYLLSHVLHDWSDEDCVTILTNCHKAMRRDGRLLIVEAIIAPGNEFSISKLLDLEMLLMGHGRERSAEEFSTLLKAAGFRPTRTKHVSESVSMVEAVPR
jgi:hypothetical protein